MTDAGKVARFLVLLLVLSLPFWLIGAWNEDPLLPGIPVSALMAAATAAAALLMILREKGWGAVLPFAGRVLDFRRAPIIVLAFAVAAMPEGSLDLSKIVALFGIFWIAAAAEELGWSGYLADPAQRLWGMSGACVAIGAIWALWHVVPLLQAGREWHWIAWWSTGTVATRVITLSVFRWSNDSVFAASILHAAQNTAWQSFPTSGSHYDPCYSAPLFLAAATICAGIWIVRPQPRAVGVDT